MFSRLTGLRSTPAANAANYEQKVKELREAMGDITGRSLRYCDDVCLQRYLVARNWDVTKAKKMLEESLKWRASYKPEDIRWSDVCNEAETGKLFKANFRDRNGRVVMIMCPGKQNTTSMDDQMKHLVHSFENAVFSLPKGESQMVWLIDFTGWSIYNVTIQTSRNFLSILQNHYPERLAMGFMYNPPRIFEPTYQIVKYFIEAKTAEKIKFVYPKDQASVELMKTYFDEENIPLEFGGKAALSYDHEEFSRQMVEDDVKYAAYWAHNA